MLALLFGVLGLLTGSGRAAQAAAGVLFSPLDALALLPVVAVLTRGWWLLRLSRAGRVRTTGGLVPRERRSVRTELRATVALVVVVALIPAEWLVVHAGLGLLAVLYGALVLVRVRRIAGPSPTVVRRAG